MPDGTVTSEDARRRFRELLDSVEHQGAHVTVKRYVRPAAVLVPIDWYECARSWRDAVASLPCPDCDVPPGSEHKPRCAVALMLGDVGVPQVVWSPPVTLAGLQDLEYRRGLEDAQ